MIVLPNREMQLLSQPKRTEVQNQNQSCGVITHQVYGEAEATPRVPRRSLLLLGGDGLLAGRRRDEAALGLTELKQSGTNAGCQSATKSSVVAVFSKDAANVLSDRLP